tara:strand:+ start:71 stop:1255 length:1185 start_codon:yes stop_codon:yes gene_type:complete
LKNIAIFTGSRSEFSLQYPLIKKLEESKNYNVFLLIGASHLDEDYGKTISEIEKAGFSTKYLINFNHDNDILSSNPLTISVGIDKITKQLNEIEPDFFIIYGDRYETFSAAIASTQMGIPTIHIEGGDVTEGGTFDDSVRHAITKLSHVHLATNEFAKKRIIQMGEEESRVFNVGLPVIDLIKNKEFTNGDEIIRKYNLKKYNNIIIFTQHSIPIEINLIDQEFNEIKKAFQQIDSEKTKILCTYPNSDVGGKKIINIIENWKEEFENIDVVKSLGRQDLHGILNLNNLKLNKNVIFIGNSSAAIKEAPSLNCPSLILGRRQNGRLDAKSVHFCEINSNKITENINQIFNNLKANQYLKTDSYYGNGKMAEKTIKILDQLPSRKELLIKKFNHC